jgi:D-glycero-alpha-D-manno-heptose 1-phosphate guanylyltransferase
MEAIVLAGGKGTRLSAVVPNLPKPMAPVAGRPFLSYLLHRLQTQGVRRVCLSTGYMGEVVRGAYGSSFEGMEIAYAQEETPLGTGGAVRMSLAFTREEDVFVMNGDTFAELDLRLMKDLHLAARSRLTLALTHVADTARYGAVDVADGRIVGFSEKGAVGPGYINAGVYLLRRDLFEDMNLPKAFAFEQDVVVRQLAALRPRAFLTSGYFIDIGVPEDYQRAQLELPGLG